MGERGRFARVPLRAARSRLGGRALRVLIAIAAHADRTDEAFPSLARISEITGIDRRGLHGEIVALLSARLIRVEHRRDNAGDPAVNLYTIVFDEGVSPHKATPIASSGDTVSPDRATRGVASGGDVTDQYGTDQRIGARRAARGPLLGSRNSAIEFEAFCQAYPPRHPHANPKKPARHAFEAAVRRGVDPAAIIRGAENYRAAVERAGTESRYVPQAVTWLRQERWNDDQEAPEPLRLRAGMV